MIARENIPQELAREKRWITWRYGAPRRSGKPPKIPDQKTNGRGAWLSFDAAIAYANRSHADGLGYIVGAGIVGVDVDDCISDDGALNDVARDALESFGTYAERSPSGRGIHLLLRVVFPEHSRNDRERGLEIYDGAKARFFTMTGYRLTDTREIAGDAQEAFDAFCGRYPRSQGVLRPVPLQTGEEAHLTDDAIIRLLFGKTKHGDRIRRLYHGDREAHNNHDRSPSGADFALCREMRFYTRDATQLDRLFRRSSLYRGKWDEQHGAQTYGAITIEKAIEKGGPTYASRRKRLPTIAASFTVRTEWFVPLRGKGEVATRIVLAIAQRADANGTARVRRSELAAELGVTERNITKMIGEVKAAGVVTFEVDREGYVFHLQGGVIR